MTEHTPGPWTEWHNEKGAFVIHDTTDVAILCQRNDWDHRAAESIANGRLIAAAPEMLVYCKLMAANGDPDAVELVSKAEGHPSR